MQIDKKTKIAALLKHHPDALEVIVGLNPDFKKLRNPVLRTLMAGRTTIAMASKIGGCTPEDFFKALAPLGFEMEESFRDTQEDSAAESKPMPVYLQNREAERLVHFDVRAMLNAGADPLKAIQEKVKSLKPGEVLVIINNFEPVPLIKLMEKQGFQSYVNFVDQETIETYLYKTAGDFSEPEPLETELPTGDWEILLKHYAGNLVELDVRHLDMPMPMMTILENLEVLPWDKALYVHHKRIPVFLLNELKDRAFDYRIKEVQPGTVFLLIFKENGKK